MRLTFVSFESEGAAVEEAMRIITKALVGPREAIPVVEAMPARIAAATPCVKRARKVKREPAAKDGKSAGIRRGGTSPGRLALDALKGGAKTFTELHEWIQAHGLPAYRRARTSALLTYLKKRGQVRFDRETGQWFLA
jgi:hypothetical protein